MKKIILAVLTLFCLAAIAQAPPIQWQQTFGVNSDGHASSVQTTQDGGYIVAGGWFFASCGLSSFSGVALKIDDLGNLKWHTCFEYPGFDYSVSIQEVPSGGYIMLSVTDYNAYDFILDPHVMKINDTGTVEWSALYPGFNSFGVLSDNFWDTWPKGSIQNTPDGGYIVAGSKDSDFFNFPYIPNCTIMKLNSTGTVQWENNIGGDNEDFATSIQNTPDGNYIFAGGTKSFPDNHGQIDFYVVKINNSGTVLWQKRLGGTGDEIATSVQATSDGGYIVAGYTTSNDGNVSGNHGDSDAWVVKLDSNGTILWQKCLGGTGNERASAIQITSDGGYIVAGHTNSNDGNVSGNHGNYDVWAVKLDPNGTISWQKCFGGSAGDYASSIQVTPDGGYIFAGKTNSNDGDVSSNEGSNIWVVKLSAEKLSAAGFDSSKIRLHPNPVNDFLHFSEELQTVAIFTINSQKIMQATKVEKIDLSELPTGMYFIKTENNAGNTTLSKILKN